MLHMKFNRESLVQISLLFFLLFVLPTTQKIVHKAITVQQLCYHKYIFVTKFDFGTGQNNITLKYKKVNSQDMQTSDTKIGLLIDQNYTKFQTVQKCQDKQQLLTQIHPIKYYDSTHGTQIFRIKQNIRQHLWYIYVYNCQHRPSMSGRQYIQFQIILMNDGSHLGQDQQMLVPYIILLMGWIIVLINKLGKPMYKQLKQQNPQPFKIILLNSYILGGLALLCIISNILSTHYSGQSIYVLWILNVILKNIAQGIVLTVLISISWGWSIRYTKYQSKYKLIAIASILTHVLCLILWDSSQQGEDSYHQYQQPIGILVFIIRIFLALIYISSCYQLYTKLDGQHKQFMYKLMVIGSIYLLSWPTAVIICELFVPPYLHNEAITIIEQYGLCIANGYICWLYLHPQSEYQLVNIKKQQDNNLSQFIQTP